MPLSIPEQPEGGPEALQRGLRNVFAASPARETLEGLERTLKGLGRTFEPAGAEDDGQRKALESRLARLRTLGTRPEDPEVTAALPRYEVMPADLRDGKLLEAAKQTGWKYFILGDESGPAMATLAAKKELHFSRYQKGSVPVASLEAMRVAEELAETSGEVFEPRFLEIPSLYFYSVWLHGATELIVPLQVIDPGEEGTGLKAVKPGVVLEFLIQRLAQGPAVPPPPVDPPLPAAE